MKLPFLKDNTKDADRRKFHKVIQKECLTISALALRNRLGKKDVDKLEKLYESYHKKYPDAKAELNAKDRIAKLRLFAK